MNDAQHEAIANADAHLGNAALPTYTELVNLLKRAKPHVDHSYGDMLCKAGAYSERTLAMAMATQAWQQNEADHKDIRAALEKVK